MVLPLALLALTVLPATRGLAALQPGDDVPPFSANADTGEIWSLADHWGKKNIIVYFYPAAMTGGCTKQACAYRDFSAELSAVDAIVIGVSGDSVNNLALFKTAHGLNFPLLSDPSGSIAELFGVPTREGGSIEREVSGTKHTLVRSLSVSRWTFVIGKDRKVSYKNDAVNAAEDSATVLAALKEKAAAN